MDTRHPNVAKLLAQVDRDKEKKIDPGVLEEIMSACAFRQPFKGAFEKGVKARLIGKPKNYCPYEKYTGRGGQITYSTSFYHSWRLGWDRANEKVKGADGDGN